jgi:ABC-type glycerol-3-phosphate transport system substrate-binding protein
MVPGTALLLRFETGGINMDTPKKISRRDFLRMAGLATGATALSACAPQVVTQVVEVEKVVKETQVVEVEKVVKETQVVEVQKEVEKLVTPTPAAVEFSMLVDPNEAVNAAHQAAIADYTAEHPNVTIKVETGGIPADQLIPWLAAGTAPGCFRFSPNVGASMGLKNQIYDIAPVVDGLGMVDKFIPAVWNGNKFKDGQVWCLPSDVNTFALWSNPVLFERAGIPNPPATWEELYEDCKLLAALESDPAKKIYGFAIPTTIGWTSFFMYWWIYREGSQWYDGKQLIYKDALNAAILKLRTLIKEGLLPYEDNWQDYWYQGRLGMQEYGQWVIPSDVPGPWNDNKPTREWKGEGSMPTFTISPLVTLKEGVPNYSILAGFGYFIAKTNKFVEETVKFLLYQVTDPKHGQMWVIPYNQMPAVKKEVVSHPYLETPTYAAFMKQVETSIPFSMYPEVTYLVDNVYPGYILDALNVNKTKADADVMKIMDEMYTLSAPIIQEAQSNR